MNVKHVMSVLRRLRPVLAMGVIVLTIGLFAGFFASNDEAVRQMRSVGIGTVLAILVLYALMMAALAFIYELMLRMCGVRMGYRENFLLTAYSSIVNFFGPLQSGPGVRMVYLKRKHGVSVKRYMLATLLYYACFAMVSAAFFLLGTSAWWLVLLGVATVGITCAVIIRWYSKRAGGSPLVMTPRLMLGLVLGVVVQLGIVAAIYGVELRSLGQNVGVRQVLAYTGTANFALFVSLTPGALGFREAFLLFTRELTGLSSATIVAANLIDRVVYVLFLALLFGGILLAMGRSRLRGLKEE
jgi:uncharacterized membrane protein YbhN (UPF0104 family)